VKATQGNNYLNPYMVADVRDAANNGMFVGLYHYFDPMHGTPEQQAEWFYRNGIMQPIGDNPDSHLEDFLTLVPMFDYEEGNPTPTDTTIERFISALGQPCGLYTDRDFRLRLGNIRTAKCLWLAWPGWTNEQLPTVTAIVQTGQTQVQGIGETPQGTLTPTDVNTSIDFAAFVIAAPQPQKEEEAQMATTEVTIDGKPYLVTYVYTLSGHCIEITRPLANIGKGPTQGDSIIDLTDGYPKIKWN
jgi:hypothetical protein